MDGNWNSGLFKEHNNQSQLSRHRILRINLSAANAMEPGDASSMGGVSPLDGSNFTFESGGPHFVLSSVTPDNSHCYGFEFCLAELGPVPAIAPFTITIWELIGTTILVDASVAVPPVWASMLPITGVGYNELWHTFDVNATAIRFQIEDETVDPDDSRSIIICLAEL